LPIRLTTSERNPSTPRSNQIGKGTQVDDLPEPLAALPLLATDRPLGHELLRRIRALLDDYPQQPMMVGEVYLLRDGESASYLGTAEAPELHLSFDFRSVHVPWDAAQLHSTIDAMQTDFAEPRWPTWVLSNHDQPRHRTRFGSDAHARAAAVMSLTMRGTPFLYAGEELGLTDGEVLAGRVVDPDGRDGCRAPIPWTADGDDEVGHGWPSRPWLPFPTNASSHAYEHQVDDPSSTLALYRRLLALRATTAALRSGSLELAPRDGELLRYDRIAGDHRVTVLINCGDQPAAWPVDLDLGEVLVSSVDDDRVVGQHLDPLEAVVLGYE
ncbi:MAG: alpha-amylase family glycosyl hydrolase, partial [Actinomycetota bacterium]